MNLQYLLDLENNQLYSLVVFTGGSEFKTWMPENVVRPKRCLNFVKSKTKQVFNDKEVKRIINQIGTKRFDKSFKTNREHIKSIKSRHNA